MLQSCSYAARGACGLIRWRLAAALACTLSALAPAQAQAQAISVPELGSNFPNVQAAVQAIGDGEGTVLLGPGTYRQCAVQTAGVVHFRSTQPGAAIFDGVECEGKAALVLRGAGARRSFEASRIVAVSALPLLCPKPWSAWGPPPMW